MPGSVQAMSVAKLARNATPPSAKNALTYAARFRPPNARADSPAAVRASLVLLTPGPPRLPCPACVRYSIGDGSDTGRIGRQQEFMQARSGQDTGAAADAVTLLVGTGLDPEDIR